MSAWIWLPYGHRLLAQDVELGTVALDSAGRDWICMEGLHGRRVWMEPARVK